MINGGHAIRLLGAFEIAENALLSRSSTGERGRGFEQLCAWILRSAPEYGMAEVWSWADWPDREAAGFGLQDLGIDLIGKTLTGDLWAIQAKFRSDPAVTLTWEELATFVGHSARTDLFRYRLVMTNTWAVPARFERATTGQSIGWLGRAALLELGLDWRGFIEPEAAVERPRKMPREHQEVAVRDVVAAFAEHDRTQLVMACGTGKTLATLWIAEALLAERTLVLVPSLSLLRQFRSEWLEASSDGPALADLCVCSDITVAGGRRGRVDELEERAADLGVPVTTAPSAIAAFLARPGRRVVFSTYQSSPQVAAAMEDADVPPFDLAVADEAHRLVAATDRAFATVLDATLIRARRRLFATATPRYLAARVKQRAAEEHVEVVSMDDPAVFGEVAHRLTFGQAIAQDLLSDYRVVVLATTDRDAADLIDTRQLVQTPHAAVIDAATLATLNGVTRAIDEFGLRRLISFHRTVERARSFAALLAADGRERIPLIDASFVSGEMTAGDRSARLDRLHRGGSRPALIANARCLTEGVDIPALDGVVFVDPRWSPIDIVQAVGRVMRTSQGKRTGTIILPIVVPDGLSSDSMLEGSAFEIIWSVVRALRSHDERLAEVLVDARTELGRRGTVSPSPFLRDRFRILDLPRSIDADAFSEAISLRIVDAGSFDFDEAVGRLLSFVEEHGHAFVPQKYHRDGDSLRLGSWVSNRRNDYRLGRLTAGQAERLEAVPGWSWEPQDEAFAEGIAHLRAFVSERGHTRVPAGYRSPDGYKLGPWVVSKRGDRRASKLSEERVRDLEALPGWSWDPLDDSFNTGLGELRSFAEETGHTRVPMKHLTTRGFKLGVWVFTRRQDYRTGMISADRISALEAVDGWIWSALRGRPRQPGRDRLRDMVMGSPAAPPNTFEQGVRELTVFATRCGHLHVPSGHREQGGLLLRNWMNNRRTEYKAGRLMTDEIAALEAIPGWTWSERGPAFEQGLAYLRSFAAENGHVRVPLGYRMADGFNLGSWVNNRRTEYRAGKLRPERAAKLDSLDGWTWGTSRSSSEP